VGILWLFNELHKSVPDKFTRERFRSDRSTGTDEEDDLSFVVPWNAPLAYVSTQKRRMVRSSISKMADIQKNIGELPKRLKREHWPWETIRRKVMGEENNNKEKSSKAIHEENDSMATEITNEEKKEDDDSTSITSEENFSYEKNKKAEKQLCIGNIFGLDVGGTLAKLVYFEKKALDSDPLHTRSVREKHYAQALSAQTVLMARMDDNDYDRAKRSVSMSPTRKRLVAEGNRFRSSTAEEYEFKDEENFRRTLQMPSMNKVPDRMLRCRNVAGHIVTPMKIRESQKNQPELVSDFLIEEDEEEKQTLPQHAPRVKSLTKDLQSLYGIRQESLPDDIRQFRRLVDDSNDENDSLGNQPTKSLQSSMNLPSSNKLMKRSMSMLDFSTQHDQQKAEALNRFYAFARRLNTHEDSISDIRLSFYCRELGGEFHFISFETRKMKNAMDLIRYNNLHMNIRNMGATGGGAHKFAGKWEKELGIGMIKQDELDSLVAGMQFVLSTVVGECFTFRPKQDPQVEVTVTEDGEKETKKGKKDPKLERWTRKVQRDSLSYSSAYPYMLVTIGTGVSVLRVDGPRKHERVSGSTIGGGTFWGLMRLLTDVENFEDAMKLAEKGDPTKVDMMVGDIYGEDSDALEKLGLAADVVASSFGKLVSKEDPAKGLTQEDLARALLSLVTNNIGQVAYLNAKLHNTPRIYFVGSFLRLNMISQRRLSYAIDYWSKGEMEALFLEHEGHFGALGAFLMTQNIEKKNGGYFQWENNP